MDKLKIVRFFSYNLSVIVAIIMFFIRFPKGDMLSLTWLAKTALLCLAGGLLFWVFTIIVIDIILASLIETPSNREIERWEGGIVSYFGPEAKGKDKE